MAQPLVNHGWEGAHMQRPGNAGMTAGHLNWEHSCFVFELSQQHSRRSWDAVAAAAAVLQQGRGKHGQVGAGGLPEGYIRSSSAGVE